MRLFRRGHEETEHPEEGASFDVLGMDGMTRRHPLDDFDEIITSTDPEEVTRRVGVGWVVLDERHLQVPERGPSDDDLIPVISSLRVGGMFEYEPGQTVTNYVLGYLRDDLRR